MFVYRARGRHVREAVQVVDELRRMGYDCATVAKLYDVLMEKALTDYRSSRRDFFNELAPYFEKFRSNSV